MRCLSSAFLWLAISTLIALVVSELVSCPETETVEASDKTSVALLQVSTVRAQPVATKVHVHGATKNECFDASSWFTEMQREPPERKFSGGHQDGILLSLFNESNLGTTNKYFVEFGFPGPGDANSWRFHEDYGWKGLEMDGGAENASWNLHSEFITPENIIELFDKYEVPIEPDYVSIDIDSCDLQVFLSVTKKYRPRAVTVEYNSKYSLEESKVNVCVDSQGERYRWNDDDMHGASLMALYKAAAQMDYTMVTTEPHLDVFLVRKDLVCPGTEVELERFRNSTSLPIQKRLGDASEVEKWVRDY